MGNTKVLVSVFDPREIVKQNNFRYMIPQSTPQTNRIKFCFFCFSVFSTNGELFCDFKFAPYANKRRLVKYDIVEKSLALSLKRALQPAVCRYAFSNFQVDIFVYVIEDDGSVLAAAITCAGLALADAGIPMYDIITASTVAVIDKQILVDPTAAEEDLCSSVDVDQEHGIIVMASLQTLEQVSELWVSGLLSSEIVSQLTEKLRLSNRTIVPIIKQILVNKVKNSIETHDNKEKE